MTPTWRVLGGDCVARLRELDAGSVHTCVTSPPYFGLRDYGMEGQIGLEPTPDEFVAALVGVFREVRRVLRDDGTVWLNLGDSYAGTWGNQGRKAERGTQRPINGEMLTPVLDDRYPSQASGTGTIPKGVDYKAKDLLGIPWMVAFALRADGWYLRSDIIWAKPNPMPESVMDRPTKAHEYVFLLSKRARYFYDADAIREPHQRLWDESNGGSLAGSSWMQDAQASHRRGGRGNAYHELAMPNPAGRNKRSVWTVATQSYASAHFATFPPKLIEPCILAGSPERACGVCGAPWTRVVERDGYDNGDGSPGTRGLGDARMLSREETGRADGFTKPPRNAASTTRTVGFEPSCVHDDDTGSSIVLDPFAGSGTTGMVALRHDRSFIGIELNPAYAALARDRITADAPLLNSFAEVTV